MNSDFVTLCIFARTPIFGQVKTRLAAEIGADAALAAYLALVEDTLERLGAVPGMRTELWLAGPVNEVVRRWVQRWDVPLRLQQGVDLGERMAGALAQCHAAGHLGLVVGTDCPSVDAAYVQAGARALRDAEVVLGPAEDGGYGLVGARGPVRALFRDVPWGTSSVLTTTLERARDAELTVRLLDPLWDVDTARDLARFREWRGRGGAAPQ